MGFPEETCPVAVEVASTIINLPTYYDKDDLKKAREIIGPYLIDGDLDGKRLDGDLSSKNEPKKVANTKGSKNE